MVCGRFDKRWFELRRVNAGTHAYVGPEQQVRCKVTDHSELRVRGELMAGPEAPNEVAADMAALKARCINRSSTALS